LKFNIPWRRANLSRAIGPPVRGGGSPRRWSGATPVGAGGDRTGSTSRRLPPQPPLRRAAGTVHVDGVLAQLDGIEDPVQRLRALLGRGRAEPPSIFIRLLDATDEPLVREAVAQAAEARVAFMARAFRERGLTPVRARRQALLVYSMYVGLAHLGRDAPGVLGDRRALNRHLMEVLVG
jgi:hypothetical protein